MIFLMDIFADNKLWQCAGLILIIAAIVMGDLKGSCGVLIVRLLMIVAGIAILMSHC